MKQQIESFININGTKTVDYFHKTLGKLLYDYCGLARNQKGLKYAIEEIRKLKQEFYKDIKVSEQSDTMNTELEKAGRFADYFEIGELMCYDALTRNESSGAHFREEYQTPDGEALRNDCEFQFISAWAWKGENTKITHMVLLPQGKEERSNRVLNMVTQMDSEHFGHCSNTEACEVECPQGISVLNIARMNYEYSRALFFRKK